MIPCIVRKLKFPLALLLLIFIVGCVSTTAKLLHTDNMLSSDQLAENEAIIIARMVCNVDCNASISRHMNSILMDVNSIWIKPYSPYIAILKVKAETHFLQSIGDSRGVQKFFPVDINDKESINFKIVSGKVNYIGDVIYAAGTLSDFSTYTSGSANIHKVQPYRLYLSDQYTETLKEAKSESPWLFERFETVNVTTELFDNRLDREWEKKLFAVEKQRQCLKSQSIESCIGSNKN